MYLGNQERCGRNDIIRACAIDHPHDRADYIKSVAEKGGLSVAIVDGAIKGFACLDHTYFFGKPFVSLLIVAPDARRLGIGTGLLAHHANQLAEVWTSTNQSNKPMRALLEKAGWTFCGAITGLDEGDPEHFYRHV